MNDRNISRRGGIPDRYLPYVFIAPLAVYLLVFQGYPLVQEVILSTTYTSLLDPSNREFIGLANYSDVLADPEFRKTLWITLIYTVVCVVGGVGCGLLAALLLNFDFWGRGLARALVTIPWAAPPVAVALIFIWMYNPQFGVVNFVTGSNASWLDDPQTALPAILATTIWQIFPFSSVVILAALQGVPSELREAAIIDGAGRLNVFKAVVWPTIRPSVAILTLLMTVWSLRRFDVIWVMTQGGPLGETNTLVIDLYRRAFVYLDLGRGAAVGVIGVGIALAMTFIYFWASARADKAAGKT